MKMEIILRALHLLLIAIFGVINYYNFAVIYFTLHRDGKSLKVAEEFLSKLCHRMPSRTIWLSEIPMGLCSRCSGIYFSIFITLLLPFFYKELFQKKYIKVALLLLLPLIIDGVCQLLGFYLSNNTIRIITGLLFGSSISYIIINLTILKNKSESL
jgi:uncharacterized membrane protein